MLRYESITMQYLKNRLLIFKNLKFNLFLLSCIAATFGAGMSYIAMSWMVLDGKHDLGHVATLMLCFWLPGVIFGPLFGVFVDRYSRKWMMVIANGARAIILILAGIYFESHFSANGLYYLALLLGLFFSLYWPTTFAFIREIVPKKDLLYANATIDTAYEVGNIVGMGSAGFFIAFFSAQATLTINGILFFISIILLMSIKYQHRAPKGARKFSSFWQDFKEGMQYLSSKKVLLIIYSTQLVVLTQYMMAPVLIAPFAKNFLHANVAQFGWIETAMSVGVVIGGIGLPWAAEKWGFTPTIFVLSLMSAISFYFFSQNNTIWVAGILYFVLGFTFASWALIITRAQEQTDFHFQGRLQSTFNSASGTLIVLTYFAVKLSSDYITLPHLYYAEAFMSLIIIFLMWLYSKQLRKIESAS
jgi:DHA3 family macrolide efflux protein-like MFS transporter